MAKTLALKTDYRSFRRPLTTADRYRIRNLPNRVRNAKAEVLSLPIVKRTFQVLTTELRAIVFRNCTYDAQGNIQDYARMEDLGVLSRRVVTTVGVDYIALSMTGSGSISAFNYHDAGTGGTASAVGDTVMQTPYGGSRSTGTQSKPSTGAYRTVATVNFTSGQAIVEHGIFSAVSSGTLLDRSTFSAINVINGDSIQFTFTLTYSAGG